MKTNHKLIMLSAIFIILAVAIVMYMRRVKKHAILMRIQATADIKAQLFTVSADKMKYHLEDKYINIKSGDIVGYLLYIDTNGYYTFRNNKGIYVPKESTKRIL